MKKAKLFSVWMWTLFLLQIVSMFVILGILSNWYSAFIQTYDAHISASFKAQINAAYSLALWLNVGPYIAAILLEVRPHNLTYITELMVVIFIYTIVLFLCGCVKLLQAVGGQ